MLHRQGEETGLKIKMGHVTLRPSSFGVFCLI